MSGWEFRVADRTLIPLLECGDEYFSSRENVRVCQGKMSEASGKVVCCAGEYDRYHIWSVLSL